MMGSRELAAKFLVYSGAVAPSLACGGRSSLSQDAIDLFQAALPPALCQPGERFSTAMAY